jgi:endonuclease-3 related protein
LLSRALGPAKGKAVLETLGETGLLSPERLGRADLIEIVDALKEKRLTISAKSLSPVRNLARWLIEHHGQAPDRLFESIRSTAWLRGELAAIKGIACAGADAILLHALCLPAYPVDRATFRVLARHGWVDPSAEYDEVAELVVDSAMSEARGRDRSGAGAHDHVAGRALLELAHGMEQLGRRFCRAAAPRCDGCPLESLLPEGGPRKLDD